MAAAATGSVQVRERRMGEKETEERPESEIKCDGSLHIESNAQTHTHTEHKYDASIHRHFGHTLTCSTHNDGISLLWEW